MQQLHSINRPLMDVLKRGFTPCRTANPTLAGRQGQKFSDPRLKG